MIKGHGDDIYNYKSEIISNFSSNIFSKQNLSALKSHLYSKLDLIHSYPEPDAGSLIKLLSEKYSIEPDNLCITNGATDAIYLTAQAFAGEKTAIVTPTFSEYEDACNIYAHKVSFVEKLENIDPRIRMIWICNPNNPTGFVHDVDYLKRIVKKHNDTVFVFDQSYGFFTGKPVWNIEEAVRSKNIILIHSMTKQYAIPGLRLGYISAHSDIIRNLNKYRMPWSINSLGIEAGKFLIKNNTTVTINADSYLKEANRLKILLAQTDSLTVFPTDTHFFLCKLEKKSAATLKLWLIENYGILIRDAANFRGLDKHYFRIAAQSPEENDRLVKAIREWISLNNEIEF